MTRFVHGARRVRVHIETNATVAPLALGSCYPRILAATTLETRKNPTVHAIPGSRQSETMVVTTLGRVG